MNNSVFIIAEAGVNHNGSLPRALAMVDAAAKAGADAIKFQTFRADKLVTLDARKTPYQEKALGNTKSQHEMLKALELSEDAHLRLAKASSDVGIEFMSTAFDLDSLMFLVQDVGIRRIKIPSGEITNPQLLLAAGRIRIPVLLSTGMASMQEIETALGVLAFGIENGNENPGFSAFEAAWRRQACVMQSLITILQCTTAYPAPAEDINLQVMDTLTTSFGLPVGFSDHSIGAAIAVAAVGRGARVIEKHFTLDRTLPGPDHAASLEVDELTRMIADIRVVEKSIGSSEKTRKPSELSNAALARRGVYAARNIVAGQVLVESDVILLRPETNRSPMRLWDIIGKPASRSYRKFDALDS